MNLGISAVVRRVRNTSFNRTGVDPSPREIANRAYRYFEATGYQMRWEHMLEAAHESIEHDEAPSRGGLAKIQAIRGRRGAHVRWNPSASQRASRDATICAAKAGGASTRELAEQHGLSDRHVRRIVAAGPPDIRLQPPVPDDSLLHNENIEVVTPGGVEGQCPSLVEWWRNTVGEPTRRFAMLLAEWTERCENDPGWLYVDVVRILEHAAKARNPVGYFIASVRRTFAGGETLAKLKATATERGSRYAEYGHVRNPRAYLATANRNERAKPAPLSRREQWSILARAARSAA